MQDQTYPPKLSVGEAERLQYNLFIVNHLMLFCFRQITPWYLIFGVIRVFVACIIN